MIEPQYQAFLDQYMGENFFTRVLQPEVLDLRANYCRAKLPFRPELANSLGIFHGGAIYGFGDALVGIACRTGGERAVTLSGEIHYIRNIDQGAVYAETVKVHHGRTTAVYRVAFTDETGRQLAEGTYTMYFFAQDRPGGEMKPFHSLVK